MPEFKKIDKNTYCREIKVDGKRRYILCFNPQLFKDQRKAREQALVNFRTFANNLNLELLGAKKYRQRKTTYAKFTKRLEKVKLNGFVDVTLNIKQTSEGVFGMFNPDLELPGAGDEIIFRKGKTIDRGEFEQMKDEYYTLRGWDVKSGMQTKKKLEELGMSDLCVEMEKLGLLKDG